jgi:uncharacterized protein
MSQTPPPPPGSSPPSGYDAGPVEPMGISEERLWSLVCHLSYFVLGIITPLIIMLTVGTRSPYVRHHAVEALNFHITMYLAAVVAGFLILAVIGIILLPLVLIVGGVFAVIASVSSYQGRLYRYPFSVRLIS